MTDEFNPITEEELQGFELADLGGASPDDYFFLRINGDSMKNIGMVDGSLVLFRKQQYAEEGQVVACLVGGESATVKRFSKPWVWFQSAAGAYSCCPKTPPTRPLSFPPPILKRARLAFSALPRR